MFYNLVSEICSSFLSDSTVVLLRSVATSTWKLPVLGKWIFWCCIFILNSFNWILVHSLIYFSILYCCDYSCYSDVSTLLEEHLRHLPRVTWAPAVWQGWNLVLQQGNKCCLCHPSESEVWNLWVFSIFGPETPG